MRRGIFWIALAAGGTVLALAFKTIFDNLLYVALMARLKAWFGIEEGTLNAIFADNVIPVLIAFGVCWFIYRLSRHHHETTNNESATSASVEARNPAHASVERWMKPLDAISTFVPLEIRRDFENWTLRTSELSAQIRKLYADSRELETGSLESLALSESLRVLQIREQDAKDKKLHAQVPAFGNLLSQLADGVIVARGFPMPHNPGNKQRDIDTAEWAVLHLDFETGIAFCDLRNGGDQYSGVMIGANRQVGRSVEPQPPLDIVFDSENSAHRFWSMESPRDENGNKKPGVFWEYRVEVKNKSSKTIRNVSVTTEHTGQLPIRPIDQIFDKIKKTSCDLKPGCSELVPIIRWPIPKIQAGMLAGPSALEYGPVRVTASGDDVQPTVRIFQFDYQAEPMLFD